MKLKTLLFLFVMCLCAACSTTTDRVMVQDEFMPGVQDGTVLEGQKLVPLTAPDPNLIYIIANRGPDMVTLTHTSGKSHDVAIPANSIAIMGGSSLVNAYFANDGTSTVFIVEEADAHGFVGTGISTAEGFVDWMTAEQ